MLSEDFVTELLSHMILQASLKKMKVYDQCLMLLVKLELCTTIKEGNFVQFNGVI